MAILLGLSSVSSLFLPTTQAQSLSTNSSVETKNLSIHKIAQNQNLNPNFERHFKELGIEGSIIIYDLNQNRFYEYNPTRNQTQFLPASTFKILNSLIALETQAIADEKTILPWDGTQHSIAGWN
ncbi:penicillin-binding transpeptidase domain-containing protein, partial [Planktothrix sp.]|uniref:penicillin-binding transpeptidase domain-containing protein n=1 Tax=Planktothrix sp. TaxID=3088171 RepID=UPI0038D4FC53